MLCYATLCYPGCALTAALPRFRFRFRFLFLFGIPGCIASCLRLCCSWMCLACALALYLAGCSWLAGWSHQRSGLDCTHCGAVVLTSAARCALSYTGKGEISAGMSNWRSLPNIAAPLLYAAVSASRT
jgi:hypothetical protein